MEKVALFFRLGFKSMVDGICGGHALDGVRHSSNSCWKSSMDRERPRARAHRTTTSYAALKGRSSTAMHAFVNFPLCDSFPFMTIFTASRAVGACPSVPVPPGEPDCSYQKPGERRLPRQIVYKVLTAK